MVKINRVYTKTGDDGTTGLVGGDRVDKDDLRVEAYGTVDELNSHLGMIRTIAEEKSFTDISQQLTQIQNTLFDIGSLLAATDEAQKKYSFEFNPHEILNLEQWLDTFNASLPELRSFVLPGGSSLNAWCHIARTVCRRSERVVISLNKQHPVDAQIRIYLNRLSDYLFVLARTTAQREHVLEYMWSQKVIKK